MLHASTLTIQQAAGGRGESLGGGGKENGSACRFGYNGKLMSLVITHVAFDTSSLIAANWPSASGKLTHVAATCASLQIPVLLPRIVLWEAETQVARKQSEARGKAIKTLADLSRATGRQIMVDHAQWPGDADLMARYQEFVEAFVGRWKPTIVEAPDIPLHTMLENSARLQAPFAADDQSFRDSAILISILGAVPPGSSVLLVAEDGFFQDRRVSDAASARGIQLRVQKTMNEAAELLDAMVVGQAVTRFSAASEERQAELLKLVTTRLPEIERYLQSQLVIPDSQLGLSGVVKVVHHLSAGSIDSATWSWDTSKFVQKTDEAKVVVTVTLDATVEEFEKPETRYLKADGRPLDATVLPELFERSWTIHSRRSLEGFASLEIRFVTEGDVRLDVLNAEYASAEQYRDQRELLIKALRGDPQPHLGSSSLP